MWSSPSEAQALATKLDRMLRFEALAVEPIRELKEEISHLRRQNESLRARLDALEGRTEVAMAR